MDWLFQDKTVSDSAKGVYAIARFVRDSGRKVTVDTILEFSPSGAIDVILCLNSLEEKGYITSYKSTRFSDKEYSLT